MNRPLICMTLTGKTLEEDKKLVKKYEKQIDMVELRVDHLTEDEQLYVKRFPSLINLPCLLTIRRDVDGGLFSGGEFSRTSLFGRALAFANPDKSKNFAYVDFEEDYHIPSIQDAAMAFGVKIIRSYHNMTEPVLNLRERCKNMRKTGYEIPKIAFMPHSISDVLNMFKEGEAMSEFDHIFCAMGVEGFPSRVLSTFANSFLTYVSPEEMLVNTTGIGHIDPLTLNDLYNFKSITNNTKLFGIIGWPLTKIFSTVVQNVGYRQLGFDNVYIPVRTKSLSQGLEFCEYMGFRGLTVADPYKEAVMFYLSEHSPEVLQMGVCDTIINKNNKWIGYNSEYIGFKKALIEFMGGQNLKRKKVSLIGDTANANMAAYVLKQLGAKVCVFGKSVEKAQFIAERYGCDFCQLDAHCIEKLDEYSTLIVQTTVHEKVEETSDYYENDPIDFYSFRGNELLFDFNFAMPITAIMKRAIMAGCRCCNGSKMFEIHAYEQFKLFTGCEYKKI
ncbi:MAG: type I 3-dehydroquinate dehydratase [Treponema sp.]|nr:type I 3-dehydroquinate dehydratase [Treponema sp.]